jgi:ubiquitin-conjugating enzyme E2 J1
MGDKTLRRIQADLRELRTDPSSNYTAAPVQDNLFEWHFTVRGPADTDFAGGIYHGRIVLPAEYPFKPPNIILLTPNGRFETHKKICLSISSHHPETWLPAWGIRLILEALIAFLPTRGEGALGALDYTPSERRALAKKSIEFACPICGPTRELLRTAGGGALNNGEDASANRYSVEIKKMHLHTLENTPAKPMRATAHVGEEPHASDSASAVVGGAASKDSSTAACEPADTPTQLSHLRQRRVDGDMAQATAAPSSSQRALPTAGQGDAIDKILKLLSYVLIVAIVCIVMKQVLKDRAGGTATLPGGS